MSNPRIELRGTEEVPFGFVYIDDTRVGFDTEHGLWASNWGEPTPRQYRQAEQALLGTGWWPPHQHKVCDRLDEKTVVCDCGKVFEKAMI